MKKMRVLAVNSANQGMLKWILVLAVGACVSHRTEFSQAPVPKRRHSSSVTRISEGMRNVILLTLLCCSFCGAQVSPVSENSEQEWLSPTRWEAIQWQPDAATALRESQTSGKPLMVFMMVNYEGRPGTDRA